MKVIVRAATVAALFAGIAVMLSGGTAMQAQAPAPAAAFEPLQFHHVHLNSVDPEAAAAYYPKPFAKTATQTTFNGCRRREDRQHLHPVHKVSTPPTNELTGPQTSVWHFGWNTPNSREYNANFRKMGLTIAQMWNGSDADAKLVDLSGDVPMAPSGFPTQEQVLELRAKGAKVDPAVTPGGFGYLRGPDGVMIENAQSGNEERFNHVHMYHEHPACAMQWYVDISARSAAGPRRRPWRRSTAAPTAGTRGLPNRNGIRRRRSRRSPRAASCATRRAACSSTTSRSRCVPWPGGGLAQHARPPLRPLGGQHDRSRYDRGAPEERRRASSSRRFTRGAACARR